MLCCCSRVCLSVCLSQVGFLLKCLNVGSRKQRHKISLGIYSFLVPKISAKLKRDHPQRGRQMQVRYVTSSAAIAEGPRDALSQLKSLSSAAHLYEKITFD